MRRLLTAGAALFISGCTPSETPAPAVVELPPPTEAALVTPSRDSCKDIAALVTAMAEPQPFASLRTGKFKLGDRELDDKFTTDAAPAGSTCELGVMSGFTPQSGELFVANCVVFSSGMLDRETNAEKAKAAFDAANNDLRKCLPQDWKARDGSQPEADSAEAMIYESPADVKRAMDASFYAYPVELKKEWVEGGRQAPGWRVTLNFQKEAAAPSPQ